MAGCLVSYYYNNVLYFIEFSVFDTNGVDPDHQTPRFAAFDLGVHCLPDKLLRVSGLKWTKCSKHNSGSKFKQTLRKQAYSNLLKISPPKNENFQIKYSDIFHISAQNIDCVYSLEPPRRGGSNEYPQSMFLSRNKRMMSTPLNPSFTTLKWGLRGQNYIGLFSWWDSFIIYYDVSFPSHPISNVICFLSKFKIKPIYTTVICSLFVVYYCD